MHTIDKLNKISKLRTAILYDAVSDEYFMTWVKKYAKYYTDLEINELYTFYYRRHDKNEQKN